MTNLIPSATKDFISANQLLNDAFILGAEIIHSGYQPDVLVALWRGGTPVAIAIQELLSYKNINNEHFVIKTRHYAGIDQRHEEISIVGLESALQAITPSSRVLIVDDVFDTGLTLEKISTMISKAYPQNPPQIRLAVPYFKPGNNRTSLRPDYFLHQTDHWLVFPHEINGLSREEISVGKPELRALGAMLERL